MELLTEPSLRWIYVLAALAGLGAPAVEQKLIGWPAIGALIAVVIAGAIITTKASPFSFGGTSYYFEGWIAGIVGGVALAGYLVGQLAGLALRGRRA